MGKILLVFIRFYQLCISPHFLPRCRYYPTCSSYAHEAVKTHGAIMGSFLAVWRVLRCNPWSKGGVDLVPQKYFYREQLW
ncbi:MAG: membrane protein insertion efficiency factor YidD [Clostridiales bacterium]|jgi:putative membrane protein insertion efficiency factor|nr:membrane protein insertion efficiency factor YidD [Clostridiales bacterium]